MNFLPVSRDGLIEAYPATDMDRWIDPSGPYNIECLNNRHCMVILVLDLHIISISNHHQAAIIPLAFCRTGNVETTKLIWNTIIKSFTKHTTLYELTYHLTATNLPLFHRIIPTDWRIVQYCIAKATNRFFGREPLPIPYKRKQKISTDLPNEFWKPSSVLIPEQKQIVLRDNRYQNYVRQTPTA